MLWFKSHNDWIQNRKFHLFLYQIHGHRALVWSANNDSPYLLTRICFVRHYASTTLLNRGWLHPTPLLVPPKGEVSTLTPALDGLTPAWPYHRRRPVSHKKLFMKSGLPSDYWLKNAMLKFWWQWVFIFSWLPLLGYLKVLWNQRVDPEGMTN